MHARTGWLKLLVAVCLADDGEHGGVLVGGGLDGGEDDVINEYATCPFEVVVRWRRRHARGQVSLPYGRRLVQRLEVGARWWGGSDPVR